MFGITPHAYLLEGVAWAGLEALVVNGLRLLLLLLLEPDLAGRAGEYEAARWRRWRWLRVRPRGRLGGGRGRAQGGEHQQQLLQREDRSLSQEVSTGVKNSSNCFNCSSFVQ